MTNDCLCQVFRFRSQRGFKTSRQVLVKDIGTIQNGGKEDWVTTFVKMERVSDELRINFLDLKGDWTGRFVPIDTTIVAKPAWRKQVVIRKGDEPVGTIDSDTRSGVSRGVVNMNTVSKKGLTAGLNDQILGRKLGSGITLLFDSLAGGTR